VRGPGRAARGLALLAASGLAACNLLGPRAALRSDDPVAAPPALSSEASAGGGSAPPPDGFLLRQRIEFEAAARRGSFEAVVQRSCGELSVIGLAPFGARAFTLRDTGSGPQVETHLPFDWPFPPLYILEDVRRTYAVPLPDLAPADGTRPVTWDGRTVLESWQGGRLRARRFPEGTPDAPAQARFEYPGGLAPGEFPMQVEIHSERHGYDLHVTTLTRTDLRCTR